MANRVTQVSRVAIVEPTDVEGRITQLSRVTLLDTQPPGRLTQIARVTLRDFVPEATPSTEKAWLT